MAMSDVLREWLEDVARDEITVSDDPRVEARENQWTFSISSEQALDVSIEDFVVFISDVLSVKRLEVEQRQLPAILFYLWFDQVSGRLCFSLTSGTDPAALDFQCMVNPSAELNDILALFLASKHFNGIPFDELTADSPVLSCADQVEQTAILDVFVSQI